MLSSLITSQVHLITGGYAGVGYELTRFLYSKNATVYLAGRSEAKASAAISRLKALHPNATGRLIFLHVDLADLSTIEPAVQKFLDAETRLDVLVNNAAIMVPPEGSKSPQGYDLQNATNVYGPFLLTVLLAETMQRTAKTAETGTVRILWAASHAVDLFGPKGGVNFVQDTIRSNAPPDAQMIKEDYPGGGAPVYAQAKAADIALSAECARRYGPDGIVSVSLNPGNLKTELVRDRTWFEKWIVGWLHYPAEMGALTELFAGWSEEVTPRMNGCYVIPWGRVGRFNPGLEKEIEEEIGRKVWEVCEGVVGEWM